MLELLQHKQKEYRTEELSDHLKYHEFADELDACGRHEDAILMRYIADEEEMHAFLLGRILK